MTIFSVRWLLWFKGSSISVLVRLLIISTVGFCFDDFSGWAIVEDFLVTIGSVRHESGVIKPEDYKSFDFRERKKDFLLVLAPAPEETWADSTRRTCFNRWALLGVIKWDEGRSWSDENKKMIIKVEKFNIKIYILLKDQLKHLHYVVVLIDHLLMNNYLLKIKKQTNIHIIEFHMIFTRYNFGHFSCNWLILSFNIIFSM